MGIFHAYDIRGLYSSEITIETAYKLAYAFNKKCKLKKVIVGYDARIGSKELAHAAVDGFLDNGVDVIFIDFCSTPMVWFAVSELGADGGLMVTASHNPKEYNGFKLCLHDSIPFAKNNGLPDLEKIMSEMPVNSGISKKGELIYEDVLVSFVKHSLPFAGESVYKKIVVDCSNGVMGPIMTAVAENLDCEIISLNYSPDGNFPNHAPNPMLAESHTQVQDAIKEHNADFGLIFDGDGDRIVFIDEKGGIISPDRTTLILAEELRAKKVVYDLRMSKFVSAQIQKNGGKSEMTQVGRPYIIEKMRSMKADVAGELSGHYYFKEFFYCDDGLLPFVLFLSYVSQQSSSVSEIMASSQYYQSGEINLKIDGDWDAIIEHMQQKYSAAKVLFLDGISVYFDSYWFNIRKSNTEPLVRINVEADSQEQVDSAVAEIKSLLM